MKTSSRRRLRGFRKGLAMAVELIERLEGGESSNALDMLIEAYLFVPGDDNYVAMRPNAAATKLIYTRADGSEETVSAWDWSLKSNRRTTIRQLRATLSNPPKASGG